MDRVLGARPLWQRSGFGVSLLGLGAVTAALAWRLLPARSDRSGAAPSDGVTIASVKEGEFDDFIQVRGRFAPRRTILVDSVQGGQVEAIHVENGQVVEAGQLLVELSNTALQLDLLAREVQVTEQLISLGGLELAHENSRTRRAREVVDVEYQIARLERRIRRLTPLSESGAASSGELEEAQDELLYFKNRQKLLGAGKAIVQRLEQAQLHQLRIATGQLERNLTVARKNLEALQVHAPGAGQLTGFEIEIGQSLSPGEGLGQVDDRSGYRILAHVDEFYLARVDTGQPAELELAGRSYGLRIAKILPRVSRGQFQVDLAFEGESPTKIHPGQTAQARLQLGQPTRALLIPNAAFYSDTGGAWVFVVARDGSLAVKRKIRLGRRNPRYIEVLDGLAPGERIIISPYTHYLDLDRLKLTPANHL